MPLAWLVHVAVEFCTHHKACIYIGPHQSRTTILSETTSRAASRTVGVWTLDVVDDISGNDSLVRRRVGAIPTSHPVMSMGERHNSRSGMSFIMGPSWVSEAEVGCEQIQWLLVCVHQGSSLLVSRIHLHSSPFSCPPVLRAFRGPGLEKSETCKANEAGFLFLHARLHSPWAHWDGTWDGKVNTVTSVIKYVFSGGNR